MKLTHLGKISLSAAAISILLAGCSSDSPPAPTLVANTDVPITATTSSTGVISFSNTIVAATSETADPLVLGDAELAVSETDEPDASI
jgi:uncharacterized lipoprotein YbaY